MTRRKTMQRIEENYQNRIRACRTHAKIDQQSQLAAKTGINRSTLNALENNRLFLSSHYALVISEALGCTLNDLFERKAVGNESIL